MEEEVTTLDTNHVQPVVLENKQPFVDMRGKQKKLVEIAALINFQFTSYRNINFYSNPYLPKPRHLSRSSPN